MFEIVISLCLLNAPDICRNQLIAGLETATEVECEEQLATLQTGKIAFDPKLLQSGPITCRPSEGALELTKVAEGVYATTGALEEPSPQNLGDVSNAGIILGDNSIAIIDSGGSRAIGERLYQAVRKLSPLPISHMILTHMHPDHVYGANVFAEAGAKVIGHANLERALQDREEAYRVGVGDLIGPEGFLGTSIPIAQPAPTQIDLGNRVLTLLQKPNAHTATDMMVFDEKTGTLFSGDLVFHKHTPALDGSLMGWIAVLNKMLDMQTVKQLVPGHGGPALKLEEGITPLLRYLKVLETETRSAIANGERISEAVEHIGRSEEENWVLFDLYNTRNATVSYTELEWE